MNRARASAWRSYARFYLLVGVIVATALLGGSSRVDATPLLALRPLLVLLMGAMVLIGGPVDRTATRVPSVMLGLFAVTMAIQLIPMPPAWWRLLPGHDQLAASIDLAGTQASWRPITLYPDLTLNALAALLTSVAVIVGYARLTPPQRLALLPWVLGIVVGSALLGLIQIGGGGDSPAYFYRNTSPGLPVGLLANRNHQAVFLALGLAMLATWGLRGNGTLPPPLRITLMSGSMILILPVIILTGSRSGLVMALAVLLLLPLILRINLRRRFGSARARLVTYGMLAIAVLAIGLIGYMVSHNQAMSISRLMDPDELRAEKRILAAPVLMHMLWDFFPLGLGHGAFEPVFRMYEPDALLTPTYFNRAHDDLLELAMSGGVPTILVMLVFAGWFVQRNIVVLRRGSRHRMAVWARLAAIVILGLVAASITDYPIRTPFLTALFTLACLWLEDGYQSSAGRTEEMSKG